MTLSTKTSIAESLCVVAWALWSVFSLIGASYADQFLLLGTVCCLGAQNFRAKRRREEEPNAKGPTPTLSNSLGRKLAWVWLLFYLTMSAKWALIGGLRLIDLDVFKLKSVKVSGHITAKDSTELGIPTYHLTYHYDTENGKSYEPRVAVNEETWSSVREGDTVPVKYLSFRPWRSRLEIGNADARESRQAITEGCLGIVLFLFGTWFFFFLRKKYPKTKAKAVDI